MTAFDPLRTFNTACDAGRSLILWSALDFWAHHEPSGPPADCEVLAMMFRTLLWTLTTVLFVALGLFCVFGWLTVFGGIPPYKWMLGVALCLIASGWTSRYSMFNQK